MKLLLGLVALLSLMVSVRSFAAQAGKDVSGKGPYPGLYLPFTYQASKLPTSLEELENAELEKATIRFENMGEKCRADVPQNIITIEFPDSVRSKIVISNLKNAKFKKLEDGRLRLIAAGSSQDKSSDEFQIDSDDPVLKYNVDRVQITMGYQRKSWTESRGYFGQGSRIVGVIEDQYPIDVILWKKDSQDDEKKIIYGQLKSGSFDIDFAGFTHGFDEFLIEKKVEYNGGFRKKDISEPVPHELNPCSAENIDRPSGLYRWMLDRINQ